MSHICASCRAQRPTQKKGESSEDYWERLTRWMYRIQARSRIGERVEIPSHLDLWMRGARYGTVRRAQIKKDGLLLGVKMDHPSVKKLVWIKSTEARYL